MCVQGALAGDKDNKDPFAGENLYRDVVYYCSLGYHRTATRTDYATKAWLAQRLKELGFSVQVMPYSTNQFYPSDTSVTVGNHAKIEALPVWWPKSTNREGVKGKLTTDITDVAGKIYLFDNSLANSVTQAVQTQIKTAEANGAIGVIDVLTQSVTLSEEILGQNAMEQISYAAGADPGAGDQTPWMIPVVTVGRKDRPALQTAIDETSDVKIKSTGTSNNEAIGNVVIGTLERGDPTKTMIVSTPYSGWFTCGGERGSGIAIWLALAEWAAKDTSGVKWIFMTSDGHELLFRGTNMFLRSNLIPPPSDVYLWTHFGADAITYNYVQNPNGTLSRTNLPATQYISYLAPANPLILDAINSTYVADGGALGILGTKNSIVAGDVFYAVYHGYNNIMYISSSNPTFHTLQDTPEVTGPALLEPMAKLSRSALEQVISGF